jgi:error-prone DNA polymerase
VVDSAVAYCLGLTRIDAIAHQLHFDRFLPDDGSKRPDIDIDFEAKRRDDIRQYMTDRYGKDHVATVAAFGAYCVRGIIREIGKVLEIPDDLIGWISKRIHGGVAPDQLEKALEKRPELARSGIPRERLEWIFRLAKEMMDIPRNVRAHSSGVVVSAEPLIEFVPVQLAGTAEFDGEEGSLRIIQWDKRSSKHCFDKFDVLCLRGQDVLGGLESRIRVRDPEFRAEQVSLEDPEVYRTIRSGELIGIPQSASPAMRQAHMRLQSQDLIDVSLVQAGIRPGVGGAVKINELILRRRGLKPYKFEHPGLEKILGHTYGIVVFQEQIDQLLSDFVGCSSGEAEDIREEIHKRRREDYGQAIKEDLLARMAARGLSESVARHVFDLVAGFKGYGFAQGHALAFAEISVRSIYCQQNYPADYYASLFDAQPAGYYSPCTLANEARIRGVKMLPPRWGRGGMGFLVESVESDMDPRILVPQGAIRVGLSQVLGLSKGVAVQLVALQKHLCPDPRDPDWVKAPPSVRPVVPPPASLGTILRLLKPRRDDMERLILIGYFEELHPNRRALLWALPELLEFAAAQPGNLNLTVPEPPIPQDVEDFSPAEKQIRERALMGLDIDRHLMAFERERVSSRGGITAAAARRLKPGTKAIVVGNPIRLRFPPTPSGRRVVFFDLEDETGLLNVTCFDEAYQRDGHAIVCSPYVTLIGKSQWRDGHTAFLASRVFPYQPDIRNLVLGIKDLPVVQSDFLVG